MPTERPLLFGEVSPTFADRRCHVVSIMDPYGRNLNFLDQDFPKYGNKGFIRDRKFFDRLSDCQLIKKDSAAWN
jgi:hypothetical protein